MKVLHISTNDSLGAGRTTYFLHTQFKKYGHASKVLVLNKSRNDDDVIRFRRSFLRRFYDKIVSYFFDTVQADPNYYFLNKSERLTYYSTDRILGQAGFVPDLIIVGWISRFINTKNLYELNRTTNAPIFWLGMDMAPFTGGCHYAWDCKGYMKNCGSCPAIYSKDEKDLTSRNFLFKSKYISKTDITLITASDGYRKQADVSALFCDKRKADILSSVDGVAFRPMDRVVARKKMNIPPDKIIILFGSVDFKETRKGAEYLMEALQLLDGFLTLQTKSDLFLLEIGRKNIGSEINYPFAHRSTGYLSDDELLALAYQAADVFVCPSIEDGGPIMINQSIMCGTPVVSFEMGVAPNLVFTGLTGYLARLRDAGDLAKGIKSIIELDDEGRSLMSRNCGDLGLKLLHPEVQIREIENLYKSVKNSIPT